ncbi:MAG: DUF302 domain-containing protein [Betaproteobacteria bacterium]
MHAVAIRRLAVITLIAAPFTATAQDGGALSSNTGIVTKSSNYSVPETIDRVEAAAKGIGAHIFNRIDYQAMSKKVKVDILPNELIIFGRGAGGPHIVKEAPLAGLDLPFKALAWQDSQGKVWVSYTTGTYVDQRYAIKGAAKYVKNIDETIGKLISEALK